jgi:hypothetical protein
MTLVVDVAVVVVVVDVVVETAVAFVCFFVFELNVINLATHVDTHCKCLVCPHAMYV